MSRDGAWARDAANKFENSLSMPPSFAPLNRYRRRPSPLGSVVFEEAIRAEIFGLARFESHAESLARAQAVQAHPNVTNNLAHRLRDNGAALEAAYLEILKGVEEKRAITPAAEWLIDNFHIVRALLRDVHDNLPPKYYHQLPKLAEGHLKNFPRVYGIAWAYVAHTDSRLDPDTLVSFVKAYQRVQPLTIGELWAISISLRVVLIENLRRLGVRIAASQRARTQADQVANEILGLTEAPARPIEEVIAALEGEPLSGPFTVQLLQRLRFQGSRFDPLLEWLEKRLASEGQNPDELVAAEHLSQTAANATVKNIITSARLMSTFDWQGYFEEVSLVEQTLRTHPTYPEMDFPTRNRYQQAIEEMARHSPMAELELAKHVVGKCEAARVAGGGDERALDPGFYLISAGRFLIEPECEFRAPLSLRIRRWYMRRATPLYLGAILAVTAAIWAPVAFLYGSGSGSIVALLLSVLGLLPASQIALGIVNRLTIALLGPRHIPRRRLDTGIPAELRTFVVVPTMFLEEHRIEEQLEQLEIYYLANPRGDLYFALLSDWRDAPSESIPTDERLVEIAERRLARLNEKYGPSPEGFDRFHVFHRRRLFNKSEGKWIGWERKRGKLHEFNRLLRGATDTSFLPSNGKPAAAPPGVRYVITLDADTRLPNGAAAQLVGAMAHPLNQARFDAKAGRVVSGYGIMQPRVTPTLPTNKEATVFQRLSTGPSGIDPYASAISDVYQDLFGEGSFTGKGIYDVDAFEISLKGRIPENSLLSHDLFEGNFARCGFVSDVEVFEDFPWHSGVAASRNHRWIRGDWQLLPWILGRAGSAITVIGRWKMIDNLRRSLVPPCAFLTLALSFAAPRAYAPLWAAIAFLSLAADPLISALAGVIPARRDVSFSQHLSTIGGSFLSAIEQLALAFAMAPHHAYVNADATARALWRLLVSHRNLLEWTTAAQAARSASLRLRDFVRDMRGALAFTLAAFLALGYNSGTAWRFAFPAFVIWYFAPVIAKFVSTPHRRNYVRPLRMEDVKLLNMTGRRIWRFFATFVTAHDNHLPPDNFQETPDPVIAHRSSPTNFGLYLLSTLAARDFGWIGVEEAAERLEKTLVSMRDLPRHEGHFYNWYETSDRRALDPRYISSVDNGNLAGHLLAVAQGCQELLDRHAPSWGFNQGLVTTFLLLQESAAFLLKREGRFTDAEGELFASLEVLSDAFLLPDPYEAGGIDYWDGLETAADRLHEAAVECREAIEDTRYVELEEWAAGILADIRSHSRDLHTLTPWSAFRGTQLPANYSAPLGQRWELLHSRLSTPPLLKNAVAHAELILDDVAELRRLASARNLPAPASLASIAEAAEASILGARALTDRLAAVSHLCHQLFHEMDFGLLYDPVRKLFSIGYRVAEGELDASFYDLMASEARLTSFVAIAKGDVPVSHWFRLGRSLTKVDHGAALLSWSGSMFEYLMPSLVMHTPEGSLMDQTTRFVVRRQVQYGAERGVPWGVSESAYNKRDLQLTYQYSNFGVPDLGLKRGLGGDLVIAPYATLLAAMIDPVVATDNLRRLEKAGAMGPFGYYEAVDYTPSRLPEGKKYSVVKCYMAHHQGMSLVSISNILLGSNMRNRFHADPIVQAAGLLLQERTPKNVTIGAPREDSFHVGFVREESDHAVRTYHNVNRPVPTTQILSNGEYTVMLTSSGSGFSRCRELAVTRWREDVTLDNYGTYFYLRDSTTGTTWSAGYQPTAATPDRYEVTFAEDRARFVREDDGIVSELEIFVSPEENAELRRLTLLNPGPEPREIEITSYSEVVIAPPLADAAHPAFSNLFVQTEFVPGLDTLIATRRARSAKETPVWVAHSMVTDRHAFGETSWESDRVKFLGRNRSVRDPRALDAGRDLSNSTGPVLDPVFSLRKKVRLMPGVPCHVIFTTMMARDREELLHLAEKFRAPLSYERVSDLAWTQAQVKLHYLGIEPDEANLFQRLGTRMLFSDPSLRPSGEIIKRCAKDVTGLWSQGISGDNPIMLLRVDDIEDRGIVRQLLKAQEYFGTKRLTVDLVILNDKASSYTQEVQAQLEGMARSGMVASHSAIAQFKGAAFVLRADMLSHEDRILLYASARAVLSSRQGSLAEQVRRVKATPPGVSPRPRNPWPALPSEQAEEKNLLFFQGLGGFTPDGREYVVVLKPGQHTPAPWINVISNPNFGFQVSESGSGYTWAANSRENQLTPWLNDPVNDPSGESIYLFDQDSGVLWSPTANPVRQKTGTYVARHGQGYSRFEHISHGIRSELTQYAAMDAPVKISRLTLENRSRSTRRIAVTGYVEWVLGFSRAVNAPGTVTELDEASGALFATNPRSNEFGSRCSFFAASRKVSSLTGDRSEFLGRNGSPSAPEALHRPRLSNRVGASLDPCAALQCEIEIPPGKTVELAFYLGQTESRASARELMLRLRDRPLDQIFQEVTNYWNHTLDAVQVKTPDLATNLLLNRWLLYQTTVCRFWARAAFYQAGGAFGFRDQLQDSLALLYSQPGTVREHILRASARQFVEGDVQHWWHPPSGRGVRTHFSDDLLWLPFATHQYLAVTQDHSLLDAETSFLEGPLLRPDQEDSYYTPAVSHSGGSLFEHCARALDRSIAVGFGEHGLPLMGAGDWNDGMNRVGHDGKGESVWLAWFLAHNLRQFALIARSRGENTRAQKWEDESVRLVAAIESTSWDGDWYRRAYFGDGTPLGSKASDECKIDSLTQTWAVISSLGDSARARASMEAVEELLVKEKDQMILLFTPPFDKTPNDPGYIRGYLPGVRENGGQYTHAAVWCVVAQAMLGNGKRAFELFSLLNPINHALTAESMELYKVEPYVLAADVYSQDPHRGRGGWTWYTGSCGWMYRAGLEYLLGLEVKGDELRLNPSIPPEWPSFELRYRYGRSEYAITVRNPNGISRGKVEFSAGTTVLHLADDGVARLIEGTLR
jgi:cyclic beta-1,2-glucan synthetase